MSNFAGQRSYENVNSLIIAAFGCYIFDIHLLYILLLHYISKIVTAGSSMA
jgi:hypothetical protein